MNGNLLSITRLSAVNDKTALAGPRSGDIEKRNALGETTLLIAALGNPVVARFLLRNGVFFDLTSAVLLKDIKRVSEILKEDSSVSKASFPKRLLGYAVLVHSKELVRILLDHGFETNQFSFFLALEGALNKVDEDFAVLRMLLETGVDLKTMKNTHGESALEVAMKWKNGNARKIISLLKKYGANK